MRGRLTTSERKLHALLFDLFPDQGPLLEGLLAEGLIDLRATERLAIRRAVEQLFEEGLGRCEAMEVAAQRFCCSYEKVRAAVYEKK